MSVCALPEAALPPALARRHRRWKADVASMQAIPGWDVSCLQTTAGPLEGESQDLYLDDFQLLYESFRNGTTNFVGSAPAGTIIVGVATRMRERGRFDGLSWGDGVCAFDARRELNSIVPPANLLSLVVSRERLCDYVEHTEHIDLERKLARGAIVINDPLLADHVAGRLMELLAAAFTVALDLQVPALQRSIQHRALELLVPVIVEHLDVCASRRPETSHMETVRRAREHAREHITQPLQVIDLCRAVGVSRRTLQASFQTVLGISPLAYLRTMRLNGARHALLHGTPGMKVRDAVEGWGFWHPSRFSQEYRRMFGELPSRTLQRRQQG
jgi:AraC family ethanolamine operon transcriptional activator